MRRLVGTRPETPRERLARVAIPGTTGGLYTLWTGTLGLLTIFGVVVHAYATGRAVPPILTELAWACVGMLTVANGRSVLADRFNSQAGYGPVPVDPAQPGVVQTAPGAVPGQQFYPEQQQPPPGSGVGGVG